MATAYENLVKHLKLAIRQLEQLKTRESSVDEEQLYDLVHTVQSRVLHLTVFVIKHRVWVCDQKQ